MNAMLASIPRITLAAIHAPAFDTPIVQTWSIVYRLSKRFNRRLATIITVATIILVIGGIIFSIIPIMVQELYLLSSNMPTYFDNIVKYFNSEGFSISNQSLNLEEEFNNLFREYGSAVGNTVVFAGRGILNAMFHFFVIF